MKKILAHAAPLVSFPIWQQLAGQQLFLPFYHLASDEPLPHIRHLYPIRSIRQFREDLDFLLKHFQVVDFTDVWDHVLEQKPFKRPSFYLTFDDGLRECYDFIMPILLEKGVPATFFLNPDFLDNKGLMFRYKASLLVEAGAGSRGLFSTPLEARYPHREVLDAWGKDIGVDFEAFLREQKPYLSTQQIREMKAKGFTFGAHSLDHPEYSQIPLTEQLKQTLESLSIVEGCFGNTLPAFAFPFTDHGVSMAFFELLRQQRGGPVLTFGSAGAKRDVVPTHLQRFPVERTSMPAQSVVSAEFATVMIRKMLGRQMVQRPKGPSRNE